MPPQLPHCTAQSNNSKQGTTENECTNGDSGAAATGWVCVVLGTQPLFQSKVNVLKEITGVPHILMERVICPSSTHSLRPSPPLTGREERGSGSTRTPSLCAVCQPRMYRYVSTTSSHASSNCGEQIKYVTIGRVTVP